MNRKMMASIIATLLLTLSACGGSSGGAASPPPPPPPPPVTTAEAYQFLNQASFGATDTEARNLINIRYEAWINQQMQEVASLQLPYLRSLPRPQIPALLHADRVDVWFRYAVNGQDQLRQRVAFALSEILVVSQLGALIQAPYAVADYYDQLALNAFGNYRELMEVVTLHPAMGVYLSMLGNQKPDPLLNIRPDENYARELMQLFSIGLVELNLDGSAKLDGQGQKIPTYNQAIIEGFAHVYTGWNFAGAPSFLQARPNDNNQTVPMQLYPAFHDTGAKTLLNGVTIPAGQTGAQDLQAALDNIFNHANVGPFIATRLIQRLVASNPSPGFVERVATVFNNNGSGVRGDLAAVVKAILLDDEARPGMPMEIDGKLKEPLLRLTQLWRAYDAQSASGVFPLVPAYIIFGQGPLQAPHVFNFFSPFHAPAGEIRDNGLVAPEFEIATEYQNTFITNYFFLLAFGWNSAAPDPGADDVLIDISEEIAVAADTNALVDLVASKLLGGVISDTLRAETTQMIDRVRVFAPGDDAVLAAEAIYFIVTSPEFAVQH
jgi:uncharacterized protein (DUF1800 family)